MVESIDANLSKILGALLYLPTPLPLPRRLLYTARERVWVGTFALYNCLNEWINERSQFHCEAAMQGAHRALHLVKRLEKGLVSSQPYGDYGNITRFRFSCSQYLHNNVTTTRVLLVLINQTRWSHMALRTIRLKPQLIHPNVNIEPTYLNISTGLPSIKEYFSNWDSYNAWEVGPMLFCIFRIGLH